MASTTLPQGPHSLPPLITTILAGFDRRLRDELRGRCEYEQPESSWGACDGGQLCNRLGDVTDLGTERTMCLRHFLEGR